MVNKLNLDVDSIYECRFLASQIADDIQEFINKHSTVSIERTVLRLLGVDGVDEFGVPVCNLMVDDVLHKGDLGLGIAIYIASALKSENMNLEEYIKKYIEHDITLSKYPLISKDEAEILLKPYIDKHFGIIKQRRQERNNFLKQYPANPTQLYVIVATGNIHEDVIQATAAAKAGADIIAVIRTTGQSLLDYVPYGITTEGSVEHMQLKQTLEL